MNTHAISRTSAKGTAFVGKCMKCGEHGLTISDMSAPCRGALVSDEDAIIFAVSATERPNDR